MKYNTSAPYAASFTILREESKIAFVLRSKTTWMNGYYSLPAGKVEKEESFTQAAIREAKEEAGATIKAKDLKQVIVVQRKSDGWAREWVDVYFEAGKWTGKIYNAEPHMHSELVWLDISKLPDNIIPPQRFALEQIEKGVHYAEYGY